MKFFRKYTLTLCWFLIMCYMLFSSSDTVPRGGIFKIPNVDKVIHFGMFGIWINAFYFDRFRKSIQKPIITFLLSTIAFGILSEIIQYIFIDSRDGSVFDFLFDLGGIFCGWLFARFIFVPIILKAFLKDKLSINV